MADAHPKQAPPAVAPNSELPGTILSIQVLRFVAAMSVVIFHAYVALMWRPGHVQDEVDHAFAVGASGVHIFFVISGFVMVYTSLRSRLTPRSFLNRRLIRIYPIYMLVAATYLVVHQLLGSPYHLTATELAGAALLLPGYSPLVIGPGWTLSFEMYFYLCFAAALFAGLRRGLVLLTGFYFLSVAARFFVDRSLSFVNLATDSLLLEFMVGAWLGYAWASGLAIGRRVGALLIVGGLALFAVGFWLPYERLPSVISWGPPALMLVAGALAFEPELRSPTGRFFAKLGDSSYLLYLSHVLLLDLLVATPISALNESRSAAVLLSFGLAIACAAIAAVGYETIELPLLKGIKRLVLNPRARQNPSRKASQA
jgi:exopolysaccharide production protein ExoZ